MQDYWLQLEKKRKSFNFQRIKMQQYLRTNFWVQILKTDVSSFPCVIFSCQHKFSPQMKNIITKTLPLGKVSATCIQHSSLNDNYSVLFSEGEE